MGRTAKPPRLEQRGLSWYIVDQGHKIACNTRSAEDAHICLRQYVAGKALAPSKSLAVAQNGRTIRHLIDAYEEYRLKKLHEKKEKKIYYETRIRLLKQGVDGPEAHSRAETEAARVSVKNIGNDRFILEHLRSFFGTLLPKNITQQLVDAYSKQRRHKGVSRRSDNEIVRRIADGTIEKELVILRAALNWASDLDKDKWFDGQTSPKFKMPVSGAKSRVRYLTKKEAAHLIKTCRLLHIRLYFWIALSTGARKEAIENLRWDDVDFERNLIDFQEVDHKNKKKRPKIQMTVELRRELMNARAVACSAYVIEYRGRKAGNVKKSLARAIEEAGLKSLDPDLDVVGHICKHSFVTWMLNAGHSYEKISLLINTTAATLKKTYGHVDCSNAAIIGDAVSLDMALLEWHAPNTDIANAEPSNTTHATDQLNRSP